MKTEPSWVLDLIRKAARQRILFLPHAIRQMSRSDRMISEGEVRGVIEGGEVVEDYPADQRGYSCLMLGFGENQRPIHVVCAPKDEYLAIITAYVPNSRGWEKDFKTRRKR